MLPSSLLTVVVFLWLSWLSWSWSCPSSRSLGLLDGDIWIDQLSASGTDPTCSLSSLPLNSKQGWCGNASASELWVEVDLGTSASISAIVVQGGGSGWVSSLTLSYFSDSGQMEWLLDNVSGKAKRFRANHDHHTPRTLHLDQVIEARRLRLHPLKWHRKPALRLEVVGCQECQEVLSRTPMASVSEVLKEKRQSRHVRRRRRRDRRHAHRCAPLMADLDSPHGWCPRVHTRDQWLQFDLGPPTKVTGVVTRGQADRSRYVKAYTLSFSNDTLNWSQYMEPNELVPKVNPTYIFNGNWDRWSSVRHFLSQPVVSRYVRLHPESWHKRIGLRVALLGCPHRGVCPKGFFRINDASQCLWSKAHEKSVLVNLAEVSSGFKYGHPSLAVDGKESRALHECAILDSFDHEQPVFTVDLGDSGNVDGVLIHMWQGEGEDEFTSFSDYTLSLGELHVHVSDTRPTTSSTSSTSWSLGPTCGRVGREHHALFQPRVHVECAETMIGRFVSLRAIGAADRWRRVFAFVICQLNVY